MKLLIENWRKYLNEASVGFDLAKAIVYTAFVLDDESHRKLAKIAPKGWKVYAHHMTILPPTDQKQRLPPSQFFEGCVEVVGIARNEMVIAVKVDFGDMAIYNKIRGIPHITIATNAGGEPAMSNDFLDSDFEPIDPITFFKITGKNCNDEDDEDDDKDKKCTITVCGKVEEVLR